MRVHSKIAYIAEMRIRLSQIKPDEREMTHEVDQIKNPD